MKIPTTYFGNVSEEMVSVMAADDTKTLAVEAEGPDGGYIFHVHKKCGIKTNTPVLVVMPLSEEIGIGVNSWTCQNACKVAGLCIPNLNARITFGQIQQ